MDVVDIDRPFKGRISKAETLIEVDLKAEHVQSIGDVIVEALNGSRADEQSAAGDIYVNRVVPGSKLPTGSSEPAN